MKEVNKRKAEYEIEDIFLERYSPRAMSGKPISKDELMTLFEAARWAPSSGNGQPWRFIYAMRDTPEFENFLSFLVEGNRVWCVRASTLIVTISQRVRDNGKESLTHSFSTGAAWENLALQASKMNLVSHGMEGIHHDLIREKLAIPDNYSIEMMIAIGKHGEIEDLPEPLREREVPSDRKPLNEIVFENKFSSQ